MLHGIEEPLSVRYEREVAAKQGRLRNSAENLDLIHLTHARATLSSLLLFMSDMNPIANETRIDG